MVFKVIMENLANRSLFRRALLSLAFTWSLGADVSHLSYDLHKINDLHDLPLYLYINRTRHNFRLLLVIHLCYTAHPSLFSSACSTFRL